MQQPARMFLKGATDTAHGAAHKLDLMRRLGNGTITHADYRTLMGRLHQYYAIIDQRLIDGCTRTGVHLHGYAYEPRAPMIALDLAAMNAACAPDPIAYEALPELPPLSSPTRVAGAAYVVEGALLGARLLERSLPETVAPPRTRTFWQWSATAGPYRWTMTRDFIEMVLPDPSARAEGRRVALATFELFHALIGLDHPRCVPTHGRT